MASENHALLTSSKNIAQIPPAGGRARPAKPIEFHRFPDLPAEIRMMVVQLVCPYERMVDIKVALLDEDSGEELERFESTPDPILPECNHWKRRLKWHIISRTPPPYLMHVSVELRREMLKSYLPLFAKTGTLFQFPPVCDQRYTLNSD